MTTIFILAGIAVILLAYQLLLNNDPDELDANGEPKRKNRSRYSR